LTFLDMEIQWGGDKDGFNTHKYFISFGGHPNQILFFVKFFKICQKFVKNFF